MDERILDIHDLLSRAATETRAFSHLLWVLSFPLDENYAAPDQHPSLRELPGWQALTADEKERLMSGGKLFLETERTYASTGLRRGGPTRNSTAGYRLLRELVERDSVYVDNLPIETWESVDSRNHPVPIGFAGQSIRSRGSQAVDARRGEQHGSFNAHAGDSVAPTENLWRRTAVRRVSDELGCEAFDARISGGASCDTGCRPVPILRRCGAWLSVLTPTL